MSIPMEVAIAAIFAEDQTEAEIQSDIRTMIKSMELASYSASFDRAKEFVLKYRHKVDSKELNPRGCLCRTRDLVVNESIKYCSLLQAGRGPLWPEYNALPAHVQDIIDGRWGCWCLTLGEPCDCYNSAALTSAHKAVTEARSKGVKCEVPEFYHRKPAEVISERPIKADIFVPRWMSINPLLKQKRVQRIEAIQEAFGLMETYKRAQLPEI